MRLDTVYLLSNYVDVNICSCKVARAARILIFQSVAGWKAGIWLHEKQTFLTSPQIPARSRTQSMIYLVGRFLNWVQATGQRERESELSLRFKL
jgi:hypothetical protein